MIVGRDIQTPWYVFRWGHFGWAWTDGKGVVLSVGHESEVAARRVMEEHRWPIPTEQQPKAPAEISSKPSPDTLEAATLMLALPT